MSAGRHRSGASKTPRGAAVALMAISGGLTLVPVALAELLRYSPYEDPGAGRAGLVLGIGAVLLVGVPSAVFAAKATAAVAASYRRWKRGLTPGERAAVTWAEVAGLTGLHLYLRERNRETSAALSRKAIGGQDDPDA